MKAIILAAGRSTRTYPLTLNKPKPLIKIANKTLIEHNLEQLIDIVDEVIIIIGYKGSMIKKQLGNKFENIKINYVEQKQQLGTGHAVLQAEKFIKNERFIVMMSDDLYFRADMRKCLKYPVAVMVKKVQNYSDFGVFIQKDDKVLDLVEKPQEYVSDLANTAFYVFDQKIFDCLRTVKKSERGEYELTDALKSLSQKEDVFSVEAKVWLPIGYPWNVLEADQVVRDDDILVGKNSHVRGKVVNCTIGDNCIIEGDVKNSVIGNNVVIHSGSVIEDSIISDHVNFRGTIKTGEGSEVKVKDKIITVDFFGACIGDNAKLENVNIAAGTLIWPKIKKTDKDLQGIVK